MSKEFREGPPPEITQECKRSTKEFDWEKGEIPTEEIQVKAIRGGGPGGQAINTTSNNMEIRWCIDTSKTLSEEQKNLLRQKVASQLTRADELIFTCQSERSQRQNKQEAMDRLNHLVRDALTPEKERVETKKSKGMKKREQQDRQKEQQKKKERRIGRIWES
ncbi:hypothetical protein HYV70_01755 [Candidatus Uhrbacteria bacterium]|nr:hypothetical protein [Candidatus Uhrbacteria bacterium]